jgi:hypothetical membrane protein
MQSRKQMLVGGLCWIVSLQFFVAQAIAQAAWRAPYSLLDNPISDLGNTACGQWPPAGVGSKLAQRLGAAHGYVCSPLHSVMNVSFILAGVLLLLGLYLTRKAWPNTRRTTWGFSFLVLAGLGKIVVGLAPENSSLLLHAVGGLGIACASIGILLLGVAVRPTRRGLAAFSFAVGSVGLAGLLGGLPISILGLGHGLGAAERVADYPAFVWMVVLGIWMVRTSRSSDPYATGGMLGPPMSRKTRTKSHMGRARSSNISNS